MNDSSDIEILSMLRSANDSRAVGKVAKRLAPRTKVKRAKLKVSRYLRRHCNLSLPRAVLFNDLDILGEMLSRGHSTNEADSSGCTALHAACYMGYPHIVDFLARSGADAGLRDGAGNLPLHIALMKNDPLTARSLLEAGASPDALLCERGTAHYPATRALHVAVDKGLDEMARLLLDYGADPLLEDMFGMSSIDYALERDNAFLLRRCLASRPGLEAERRTCLHVASSLGKAECRAMLLAGGEVELDCRDANGMTALHLAARAGDLAALAELLARGADAGARDEEGRTPLHELAACGSAEDEAALEDAARELLARGCDVNARDERGATALHEAVAHNRSGMLLLLVSSGAEVDGLEGRLKEAMDCGYSGLMDFVNVRMEEEGEA